MSQKPSRSADYVVGKSQVKQYILISNVKAYNIRDTTVFLLDDDLKTAERKRWVSGRAGKTERTSRDTTKPT